MGGDASLTGEMDDMRTTAPPGRRVRLVQAGPYTTLAPVAVPPREGPPKVVLHLAVRA
ncbi:MAG: hypothetical protein QOD08_1012 [Gaiellaceae bacterium]|nr:hypothetical protein [Gaiellaceae bacterium]